MSLKLNANSVVLGILVFLVVAIGADVVRRASSTQAGVAAAEKAPARTGNPPFKVGDVMPDFTLPDANGLDHSLSSLVHGDTLVWMTCGCANCRSIQSYVAKLLPRSRQKPAMITVTSMPPEGQKAYLRDVGLRGTYLYDPKGAQVMDKFQGHPCPRVFRVDAKRRVTWISPWFGSKGMDPSRFSIAVGNQIGLPREDIGTVMREQIRKKKPTFNPDVSNPSHLPGVGPGRSLPDPDVPDGLAAPYAPTSRYKNGT